MAGEMSSSLADVLIAVAAPLTAAALGAGLAAARSPSPRTMSGVQHLAAGVIFGVVAVELVPGIAEERRLATVIGAIVGLGTMIAADRVSKGARGRARAAAGAPLVLGFGVDLAIDGLLLGIAFSVGDREGTLLAAGLTIEVLALGLALAGRLRTGGASRIAVLVTPVALTLLLAGAAILGFVALGSLGGAAFAGVLGFGAAVLLYLVTEELLADAHRIPDTPAVTAMFLAGVLAVLML